MNEMQKQYLEFAKNFLSRFSENERQKVASFLDFLMNNKTHMQQEAGIEDLFYVFSEDALNNGNFRYIEFSSWQEIENWNPQEKIDQAYLFLSAKNIGDIKMTEIVKICDCVKRHFSSSEAADSLGVTYWENEESLSSKLIYTSHI